jgi:predicted O-methyltransferase YrrM
VSALLPQRLRSLTPQRLKDDPRVRAAALGAGLIPPRTMHAPAEAALLVELAAGSRRAVEIGVYEGSSAVATVGALPAGAELHLIDPFGHHPDALRAGDAATAWATRRAVARAARARPDVRVVWHVERSEDTAAGWSEPVDLVFVDGDHSEEGCELDWRLWQPHVAPGGRVVFHDARDGSADGRGLPGPTAVVDRTFRDGAPPPGWAIEREVASMVVARRGRRA